MIRAVAAATAALTLLSAPAAAAGAQAPAEGPMRSPAPLEATPGDSLAADGLAARSVSVPGAPLATEEPTGLAGDVVGIAPMALAAGEPLTATVTATNTSTARLDDVVLTLAVTDDPLADQDALTEFLADPGAAAASAVAQEPDEPEPDPDADGSGADGDTGEGDASEDDAEPESVGISLAPGASATLTVEADATALGLPDDDWGVYGVSLTLSTADASVAVDAMPITWQGDGVPQLDLAVLAVADGVPSRVGTVLRAAADPAITVAADPTEVTSAMVFDSGLLEQDSLRLAAGSPDLTSLAHAQDPALLDLSLSMPAATPLGGLDDQPWIATPAALDGASVTMAAVHGAAASLALPGAAGFDGLVEQAEGPVVEMGTEQGGALVLVPEASLSDAIAQYRPGTPAAQARAVAESALVAGAADGDPALVALGQDWRLASMGSANALDAVLGAPWVTPMSVEALLDGAAPRVTLPTRLDAESDLAAEDVATMGERLDALALVATVTDGPERAVQDWAAPLLAAVSTDLRGDPLARDAAVEAALEQTGTTVEALRIPESSDLNLLAASGEIPVTVVNGLDRPATVTVDLTSFSPNLQVLEIPTVTVAAQQEQVALVPVEAVSSANVRVSVVLRNADDLMVAHPQSFAVRVRADWGNVATLVFSVLLVLLLIAGIVRTVRRGRKDTRAEPAPAPDTVPDDDPSAEEAGEGDVDEDPARASALDTGREPDADSDAEPERDPDDGPGRG